MYKGKRDPEIRIVVMQKHCAEYKSKQNLKFIEIFIPPEDIHDYDSQWGSIMVKPEQVFYIPNTNANLVNVNNGADIVCSVKDDTHKVISSETLQPTEIIGRILKYHSKRAADYKHSPNFLDVPSKVYYDNFEDSRMYMYDYIMNMYA